MCALLHVFSTFSSSRFPHLSPFYDYLREQSLKTLNTNNFTVQNNFKMQPLRALKFLRSRSFCLKSCSCLSGISAAKQQVELLCDEAWKCICQVTYPNNTCKALWWPQPQKERSFLLSQPSVVINLKTLTAANTEMKLFM